MKKSQIATVLIFLISLGLSAQKKNVNTKPYPYGNPVIRHMYTADAAPKVMPDGRIWMVTSVDHEDGGGYATMHCYHTFSTSDMVNWTDHGEVFNINDALQGQPEPEGQDWALWAPDIIYKDGKYYLYYPVRIANDALATAQGNNGVSYIAVAVSNHPTEKFKVVNPHIKGTEGIDPSIFIDDDGQAYLFWGNQKAAKLKDNMIELAENPIKLDLNTNSFMEAIWMHKRKGKYYVSYHTLYDWRLGITSENVNDPKRKTSDLAYSLGVSPMGPFAYGGTLNYAPGHGVENGPRLDEYKQFVPWRYTLSNHGGIVEYHGQEYLFYHTSALSSWRQDEFKERGTWTQRSVCVEYLNYNSDGSVIPVQQTIEGVAKIQINQPYAINLDCKKAKRSKNASLQNNAFSVMGEGTISYKKINLGTGYYYFEADIEKGAEKARIEIRKGSPEGLLMGTLLINNESTLKNVGKSQTFLREANGTHDIYLVIKAEGNETVTFSNLRFFAGSPKIVKQDAK
jgi:arabinoxylan arabinofuranohydrolase